AAPDDPELVWACRAQLAAWGRQHGPLRRVLPHEGPVNAVAFSPDGRTLLTGSDGCVARLWDAVTGAQLATLPHESPVTAAAFAPDGRTLLTRRNNSAEF